MRRHIDLFSGIGGFALAAHWAGYQTEVFCEQDQFCQQALSRHWPTVPIVSDIRDFDGSAYRGADLLTGGFPCQPFSCAGKQRGDQDDRFLWPEMLRVISEARPRWIVGENVAGIINMALDGVLSDLENEGYATQAFVIPACGVNAPHKRERVWIVAYADRNKHHGKIAGGFREANEFQAVHREADNATGRISGTGEVWLSSPTVVANAQRVNGQSGAGYRPGLWHTPFGERTHVDAGGTGDESEVVADPESDARKFQSRQWEGLRNESAIHGKKGITGEVGRFTESRLGERDDGLPEYMARYWDGDWERGIPRVATGIPQRAAKLKAMGNAIVPQVAYEIISRIPYP